MGNILRLLGRGDGESCCSLPKHDIFVDFENAQPRSREEALLYDEAETILRESKMILHDLSEYKGASKEIREAIARPTAENENRAWVVLIPLILKLKSFYVFSKKMEFLVPKILNELISPTVTNEYYYVDGRRPPPPPPPSNSDDFPASIVDTLDDKQALVKQFAKVLEFVLKFDEMKLMNSALQNDFSYYKRTTQRSNFDRDQCVIPMEMTSSMSLFFGHATPMLQALSKSVADFTERADEDVKIRSVETLSVMANVCQKMLGTPDLKARIQQKDETELFILRVMTAIIILYDHVHPQGAFHRSSHVDVKGCVRVLRDQDKSRVESLFNALRYTTKHLNDNSTPKSIKALLFEELS